MGGVRRAGRQSAGIDSVLHRCECSTFRTANLLRMTGNLSRRVVAEAIGTAFLLDTVVGSGIMGERLAAGNVAIALLPNSIATGTALAALILTFSPISGSHFNPAVTISFAARRRLPWQETTCAVVPPPCYPSA